jgi:hypothetical protein
MENVMPKYTVNRASGWPLLEGPDGHTAIATGRAKFHQFDESFESSDTREGGEATTAECEKAVEQGYLLPAGEPLNLTDEERAALPKLEQSETHDASELAFSTAFTKEEKASLKKVTVAGK